MAHEIAPSSDRAHQMTVIRRKLHPTDPSYSAEPLDIDEARWLLETCDTLFAIGQKLVTLNHEMAALALTAPTLPLMEPTREYVGVVRSIVEPQESVKYESARLCGCDPGHVPVHICEFHQATMAFPFSPLIATDTYGSCQTCDGYVLNVSEAPYCPSCARERRERREVKP